MRTMASHDQRKVLLTGATGGIGQLLEERLADSYDLVLQGRTPRTDKEKRELRKVDLTDFDAVLAVMEGVDTVVHLAGAASPTSEWDDVLQANIIGLRNTLEAARQAGVRRFVFASSNHAMGLYDRDGEWPVYPHFMPRGDSLYGVSKIFGEALGRFYHDEYGIDFIALRIGWSAEDPMEMDQDVLHAMWLSDDDAEQVFRRAIEADVTFGLYYAISDNPNRRWDLTNTMLELGYRPKDSWTETSGETEDVIEGGAEAPQDWPKGS